MSKQEFLALLREGLSGLPREDAEERLAFYGEMIDDLMEDGMTEEDAVARIGPVDSVVSLSSGEQAKVVKNNPGFMLRPNVVGIRSGRLYKLAEDISCASIVIL